jgi:hypothetical protein
MARFRFGFWWVFLAPVPFLALAFSEKWAPKVFGAEAYARFVNAGGMTITGVVLAVGFSVAVIIPFLKPMLSFFGGGPTTRRILKTGRPAQATILAVGENSGGGVVTVNDQPYLNLQVRVEDGFRAPYDVSFDTIVPRSMVPQFQPGAVIPVKVDPNDPRKVVIDWQ